MSRGPRVVLLGKQGAGKGTQAARLAEHYRINHLATGDLLRAAARAGTELGQEAGRYMNSGNLVPDGLVVGIVQERFRDEDLPARGFVLDGFPRTRPQAEALEQALAPESLDIVVDLEIPTDLVLERIAARKTSERRDDDKDEAIRRRLELYELETAPLIDFYRRLDHLVEVDAVGEPDEVFKRLVAAIDERMP